MAKSLFQRNLMNISKRLRKHVENLARSHRGCSKARGCGCLTDEAMNALDEAERLVVTNCLIGHELFADWVGKGFHLSGGEAIRVRVADGRVHVGCVEMKVGTWEKLVAEVSRQREREKKKEVRVMPDTKQEQSAFEKWFSQTLGNISDPRASYYAQFGWDGGVQAGLQAACEAASTINLDADLCAPECPVKDAIIGRIRALLSKPEGK